MAKRRGSPNDEDNYKANIKEEEDSGVGDVDKPLQKRAKHASKDVSDEDIVVKTTPEGDKYVELGKKKRATVRTYKGTTMVDIREFYGETDLKPGKKGISLTLDQWQALKISTETIDSLFSNAQK